MEDLDSVVGRTAAGSRFIADQSRVTDASHIHPKASEKIIAPELPGIFTDAIDRAGFDDRPLGTVLPGRGRAEHGNTAGPVHFMQFLVPGDIQYVQQSLHT